MDIAKLYGIWGSKYYRTENGETYSIMESVAGGKTTNTKTVFYWENAKANDGKGCMFDKPKVLTEEEYKKIKFVD